MKNIEIMVNGEKKEVQQDLSIQELLDLLEIKSKMLVVERNKQIIDKHELGKCKIEQGDTLEIVGFFGGG